MEEQSYKLSVENRLSKVETTLNEIKDNHLVHLDAKVDRIQWLLVITLVGLVANLVLKRI